MFYSTLMPTLAFIGRRSWDSCAFYDGNPVLAVIAMIAALAIALVYYVFLVKAIKEMLKVKANSVLLAFAFIALIPFPFTFILGIFILIIWRQHKVSYQ